MSSKCWRTKANNCPLKTNGRWWGLPFSNYCARWLGKFIRKFLVDTFCAHDPCFNIMNWFLGSSNSARVAWPVLASSFCVSMGRKRSSKGLCCTQRGCLLEFKCLLDDNYFEILFKDILEFIKQAQERVLAHQEEQALLKAYIAEWRKFFTQCSYLPMPFGQLEAALQVLANF